MTQVLEALAALQAHPDAVVHLQNETRAFTDRNADYSDLLGEATPVQAVIECDRAPLIYIAAGTGYDYVESESALAGKLANRSSSAALISVDATLRGRLWRCRFEQHTPVDEFDLRNPEHTSRLILKLQEGLSLKVHQKAQEFELRDLLKDSVRRVADSLESGGVGSSPHSDDVLALVGRAVFSRFLLDRNILSPETAPDLFRHLDVSIESAFEYPSSAAILCSWLDDVFNGELLPLSTNGASYKIYFDQLRKSAASNALLPLSWIMSKTHSGGQLPLWDWLDFSHIPAGVLSEVYEDFAHYRSPTKAKNESIHYTPRHIARAVVDQAILGLPKQVRHTARILDPAVGAGVFLCLCFRELAKWEYRNTDTWPDTLRLREMLYGQLAGFDINQDALKLSALSLYLSAIELDPAPFPPEKLHFSKPLIGTVLFNSRTNPNASDKDSHLGSLRAHHPEFGKKYDIVVGNPPWTSLKGKQASGLDRRVSELAQSVANERGINIKYVNPDNVPDLPFVWKSADFLVEGGVIALVLHGRLLSKSSDISRAARAALFQAFSIQGILNGCELVDKMEWWWPTVAVPFCVLFARNSRPEPTHTFAVLTPQLDGAAQRRPHLRLDHTLVTTYDVAGLQLEPDLPLVLGKASVLDAALIRKVKRRTVSKKDLVISTGVFSVSNATIAANRPLGYVQLADYLGSRESLRYGRGYKEGDRSKFPDWEIDWSRVVEIRPTDDKNNVWLDAEKLGSFHNRPMERLRDEALYRLPILLIREAPGEFGSRGGAILVDSDNGVKTHAVFSASFLGVSLAQHPQGHLLGKYLTLVLSSIYAYHFYLLTTGFAERRRIVDIDLGTLPIIPIEDALASGRTSSVEIDELFRRLAKDFTKSTALVNEWVARLMNLSEKDLCVIHDTVQVASPYKSSRTVALESVGREQLDKFCAELKKCIAGYMGIPAHGVFVSPIHFSKLPGWEFIAVDCSNNSHNNIDVPSIEKLVVLILSEYPASQIVHRLGGSVVIGQPSRYARWLVSRASILVPNTARILTEKCHH